jgi:hypothetical protein
LSIAYCQLSIGNCQLALRSVGPEFLFSEEQQLGYKHQHQTDTGCCQHFSQEKQE